MSVSRFDYPNINVSGKSNEQNMQAVKSYLNSLSDQLNYYLNDIEKQLSELKSIIENK